MHPMNSPISGAFFRRASDSPPPDEKTLEHSCETIGTTIQSRDKKEMNHRKAHNRSKAKKEMQFLLYMFQDIYD